MSICGVGYLCPSLIEDEHTCDPNTICRLIYFLLRFSCPKIETYCKMLLYHP